MPDRNDDLDLGFKDLVGEVVTTVTAGLKAAKSAREKYGKWTDHHAIHGEGVVSICEGLLGQMEPALCDPLFPAEADEPLRTLVCDALAGEQVQSSLVSWKVVKDSLDALYKECWSGKVFTFPATPYIVDGLWSKVVAAKPEDYSSPFAAALVVRTLVDLFRLRARPVSRLSGEGRLDPTTARNAAKLLAGALCFLLRSRFPVQEVVDQGGWKPAAEEPGTEEADVPQGSTYRGSAWSWGDRRDERFVKPGTENSLCRPSVFFTANAAQALAAYLRHERLLLRVTGDRVQELPNREDVEEALEEALLWLDSEGEADTRQFTARGEWGEWGREGKHELVLDAYALLALDEGWAALGRSGQFASSVAVNHAIRRLYAATRLDSGVDAAYHTIGGQPGDPWVILFPWEDYSFPYLYLQLLCNLLLRYRKYATSGRGVGDWVDLPLLSHLIRDGWGVVLREGRGSSPAGGPPREGWNRLEYRVYCTSWGLCAAAKLLETITTRDETRTWLGNRILEPNAAETLLVALETTLMDRGFFGLFAEQVASSVARQFRRQRPGALAAAARD